MAFISSLSAAVFGSNSADTINSSIINGSFSTIYGGLGNDLYFIDAFYFDSVNGNTPADVVVEALGGGLDTVRLDMFGNGTSGNGDFTLYDNVENLEASLSTVTVDSFTLTGNNLANKISITDSTISTSVTLNGLAGNDTLIGGLSGDELVGGTGADSMVGGDGSDTYYVDNVLDQVIENAGADNDYVYSSVSFTLGANVESLELQNSSNINGTGNALNNTLLGNNGNNILNGLAGNDDLRGYDGNDTLNAGAGHDVLRGGDGNDALNGDAGDDLLYADDGNDTVNGGAGNDRLHGGDGNDTQLGGAGNDSLYGNNNSGFTDKLDGGAGDDFYRINSANDVVADTGVGGSDTVLALVQLNGDLGAGVENLELSDFGNALTGRGNALNNSITGNSLNNSLFGLAGNDTLNGGTGNDLMRGGDGNDTYYVDSANDAAVETNASTVTGGKDTVFSSALTFTLGTNVENLTLTDTARYGNGNATNNVIIGNNQFNELYGFAGDDTLDGGAGDDFLAGGDGNDTYLVDNFDDIIYESGSTGIDTVRATESFNLSNQNGDVENLVLLGTGDTNGFGSTINNTITGNNGHNYIAGYGGDDTLIGGLGDDELDGGIGADSMVGGLGDDFYHVNDAGDKVLELTGQGIDTVSSTIDFNLTTNGVNVENLELAGAGNISGTGNALNNEIYGNSGNNILIGAAGDDDLRGEIGADSLDGGDGNDTLYGGTGIDTLTGGLGNDIYQIDVADDVVNEGASAGTDTLVSYRVGAVSLINSGLDNFANIENVTLGNFIGAGGTHITGNGFKNVLIGNNGNNIIDGGANDDTLNGGTGTDTLVGGLGNDVFIVDTISDVITELAGVGSGSDRVESSVTYSLVDTDGVGTNSDNVESLTLTGTANINGTGNSFANIIKGNDGRNSIDGGDGNDTLFGDDGRDTLTGGAGVDSMVGGAGDDEYYVDNVLDIVVESAVNGYDYVYSTVTFTLGANVDDLGLQGTNDINGTGNALNNELGGNDGNNTLNGLAGNDRLDGYAGNDVLNGGDGNDGLYGAIGNDTLNGGAGNDNLLGNGNSIFIDKLDGGAGNDLYRLYSANDVVADTGVGDNDTVRAHVQLTGDLGAGIENLELHWNGNATDGRGNALNNLITGNGNNNILFGLAGNDSLNGDSGADTLIGGLGNDVFFVDDIGDLVTELAGLGSGSDRVESSITFSLVDTDGTVETNGGNVENLTLTGTDNINGTGNSFANIIKGNDGYNNLSGGAGNDTLFGGDGNDTINGGVGVDSMAGGAGDDLYYVNSGLDIVIEGVGAGEDFVYSSVSFTLGANIEKLKLDSLGGNINGTGNALANRIYGNSGNNIISGLGGDDYSSGGLGNDVLNGGYGNDRLLGGGGNDTLLGGAGNDTLNGGIGTNKLDGGAGNDLYVIDSASDIISDTGIGGSDTLLTFVQLIGDLGAGIEQLELASFASIITGRGNALNNIIYGNNFNNSLFGLAGNDYLIGESGADTLDGGAGNDTLDGGLDDDSMTGGDGNDTYYVDSTLDVVTETNASPTGGVDTVFSSASTFTLGANIEKLTLEGAAITGTGNTLANTIIGNDANNSMDGGDGNDTLNGGAGIDTLVGGMGDDVFFVDDTTDVIQEFAGVGTGTDSVESSATFTLSADVEKLKLNGTGDINGAGNSGDNTITGNSGNNFLDGLTGNDTLFGGLGNDHLRGGLGIDSMIGGLGDDFYDVTEIDDKVSELAGQGIDTISSNVTYSLVDTDGAGINGGNVENLTLIGAGNINATGNALNNIIIGNIGDNSLVGGAGDDNIDGAAGLDNLIGGLGNDFLNGGDGNDTIDGGDGADVLDGGVGDDSMRGGLGNDTYVVDSANDTVVETNLLGSGIDTVFSSAGTFTLGANIENLTLTGAALINGTGNTLANKIIGNSANNSIDGGDGADTLNGGAGADTLIGGLGNDVFIVDDIGDVVTEFALGGIDRVESSITYSLVDTDGAGPDGGNVENLTLTGTGNIEGTGNANANTITGNSGNNTINGGAGIDSLVGGAGDDTYYVDIATDKVIELAGQGDDTVISSAISFSLATFANVENLELDNVIGVLNGTGNASNNTITGNANINILSGGAGNDSLEGGLGADTLNGGDGNDTLNGGAGIDNMVGGLGNDTYFKDDAGDVINEVSASGNDTLIYQLAGALSLTTGSLLNIENAMLENGFFGTDIIGNILNNALTGNSDFNSINGGAGNDTLTGGLGVDTLVGGLGNDVFIVHDLLDSLRESTGIGSGIDLVKSSVTYDLAIDANGQAIENLTLTGTSNINGYGNTFANVITGNSSNNILFGDIGNDTLIGGLGNDELKGSIGADSMVGGLGDDYYYVDVAGDIVVELAGQGIDTVYSTISFSLAALGNIENLDLEGTDAINGTGNALDNYIQGNGSANILNGSAGNDYLFGESGADTLIGGLGNDTLDGGFGSQRLEGGLGNDVFRNFNGFGSDDITDFVSGFDSLSLTAFAGLSFTGAAGSLLASQFVLGTAAADVDDFIIYDQTTGNLYYDANGNVNGAADQVQIFDFTLIGLTGPALSSTDIFG